MTPSPSWLVSMLGGLTSCGTTVHVSSWPEALSTACVTLVYYIPSVLSAKKLAKSPLAPLATPSFEATGLALYYSTKIAQFCI